MPQHQTRYCRICGGKLARDNPSVHCGPCSQHAATRSLPPDLPPDFWDADPMPAALASWHIGQVIRAYRHHPQHGPRPLPQELVGGWLGLTQAQLSRLEGGPAITDLSKLVPWASTLKIPSQRLWFKLPGEQRPAEAPTTTPDEAQPAPEYGYAATGSTATLPRATVEVGSSHTGPGDPGDIEDVRRSEFLTLAGTTLAGVVAPPLVHGWRDQHVPDLPLLTDDLLVQLRAQTEGFRWRDRQDGARLLLPRTMRYAHQLANFWRLTDDSHPLRPGLGQIAADACHLVAYQTFDQGDRAQAIEWYRSSAELAARSAAQDMYVFALCGVAYMYARNGRGDLALPVLQQLLDLPLSAAARCYIAAYDAHAYASAGQRDAARKALDDAAAHAERTNSEAPSPWLGIPDLSFVDRQRAIVLAQLGVSEALGVLEQLDQHTPAVFQRYQVTLQTNFAMVYAQAGEVERATAHLAKALERNRQTTSVEKIRMMLEVRKVLAPHSDSEAVQAVDALFRDSAASIAALSPGGSTPSS